MFSQFYIIVLLFLHMYSLLNFGSVIVWLVLCVCMCADVHVSIHMSVSLFLCVCVSPDKSVTNPFTAEY